MKIYRLSQRAQDTRKPCQRCKGQKSIYEKGQSFPCPMCNGKGYTDESDRHSYLHGLGVAPHDQAP